MSLDRRVNAIRDDLADAALRGAAVAPRYANGWPAWAVAGLVPVRHEPRPAAAVDTYYHYGEAVRVFDSANGYAWCQSLRDCYVGYVAESGLAHGDPPTPTHFVSGQGAYRYVEPDLRSPVIDFLPRHAAIAVAETGIVCRGTAYARLDAGGFLPEECLASAPPRSGDLAAAASLYLGCPYLWGGRSFLGLDCSGLVQEAFRDLGIAVPRDSDMQREAIGSAVVATRLAELRRDDLIFMPGHVMIYAGKGRVIHAHGGNMSVRRDRLAALARSWNRSLSDFVVRRRG